MKTSDLSTTETGDGSITYADPLTGAHYRSIKGAASESRHVFVEGTCLPSVEFNPETGRVWRVLELGFGTGMNFACTLELAQKRQVQLIYVSLEPQPLPVEAWLVPEEFRHTTLGHPHGGDGVTLQVIKKRWQDFPVETGTFDAYYHDPFAPAVHPDCWTQDCFTWAKGALKKEGILATYGAAGASRRAMKAAGFLIGVLPGAVGKREMTVASQSAGAIKHAKAWKRRP